MLLSLSITGIILSAILLSFNAGKYSSSLYLGAFFILISCYGLIQYVMFYSDSVALVCIVYQNFSFIPYLIGPMIYWYVRSVLTDNGKLRQSDLWHLLPAMVMLAASVPYILTPYSYKYGIATQIVSEKSVLGSFKATFLHELLPIPAIYISRPLLILGYSIWSTVLLGRYLVRRHHTEVFSHQHYMVKWLSIFLGFFIILVISHLVMISETFVLRSSSLFFTMNMLQILSATGLAGLLISPLFFPGILYGLPRIPVSISDNQSHTISADPEFSPSEQKGKGMETHYIETIRRRTEACMNEFQPFLQPDCNLTQFSRLTQIPAHHLAYYFREERRQTFTDYRNELRIKYAKRLIEDGKAKELTLEAIGLLSGFSTRNTFFTSFKKYEGVSPGTWVARMNNQ